MISAMVRVHALEVLLLTVFLLASCFPTQDGTGGGAQMVVLNTALPGAAQAQRGGAVLRLPVVAHSSQPTMTPGAEKTDIQPTQPKEERRFKICSPLIDISLTALPEIVSDPYHPPPPGREERHHGVDFSYYRRGDQPSIEGTGVQSVLGGLVAASVTNRFPYGNVVIIETTAPSLPPELAALLEIGQDRSLYILYSHMQSAPLVALGEMVDSCQALGAVGRSGNAGGPHLHLEARLGPSGQRFDSLSYYKADATSDERANYLRWRTGGEFQHFDPMTLFTGGK